MNNNQLITINQNTKLLLTKSKSLLDTVNKIVAKNKTKINLIVGNPKVWHDPISDLIWQVNLNGKKFTFEEALNYAQKLNREKYCGYDNWRVPTINELKTLISEEKYICKNGYEYFIVKPLLETMENVDSDWWWTNQVDNTMDFSFGFPAWGGKDYRLNVRCVRDNK